MAGAAEGGVVGEEGFAVKVVTAIIHQSHPLFAAGLDGVFKLMDLVFTDQGAYFEGADGPKMREDGWRKMLEELAKSVHA